MNLNKKEYKILPLFKIFRFNIYFLGSIFSCTKSIVRYVVEVAVQLSGYSNFYLSFDMELHNRTFLNCYFVQNKLSGFPVYQFHQNKAGQKSLGYNFWSLYPNLIR